MEIPDFPILDLSPANVPFVVFAKAGVRGLIEFFETNDDGSQGDPFDFADWSDFNLVAYDPSDPSVEYFALTQGSGLEVTDNTVTVTISESAIEGYYALWREAAYYLTAVDPNAVTLPLSGGVFVLTMMPTMLFGQGGP